MYIVEPMSSEVVEGRFRFYNLVDKETADGSTVQVKEEVGNYSLAELNSQKDSLTTQLAEVQGKIDEINALN